MSDMQQLPREAFSFSAEVAIGDNGSDSKSAPITMTARTGDAILHPYWGEVVHDLEGMQLHKSRLPIDYAHSSEVLGYLNHFSTESGDLVVSGALTPFQDQDRTSEVIHKMRQGVPYEASINFAGGRPRVERVPEGSTVEVNGREFEGPITVIREWGLRGVAVVPYGADMHTSAMTFSSDETVACEVIEMSEENIPVEGEVTTDSVEAETAEVETEAQEETPVAEESAVEAEPAAESAEPSGDATELSEGQRFLEAFGDRGGVWFAQGLSFDEAQERHVADLRAENESLRQRVAELESGSADAVEFSVPGKPKPDAKKFAQQGIPRSAAAFAAAFEARQQRDQS